MPQNKVAPAGGSSGVAGTDAEAGIGAGSDGVVKAIRRIARPIISDHPQRTMKSYTVSANEMMIMGATSALGSFALYGAIYFYKHWVELSKLAPTPKDVDMLGMVSGSAIFCIAATVFCYGLLGGIIVRIKWESGVRWWRLLF